MANKTINLNRSASSGTYIIGKIVCDATADYDLNNSDVTCRIYVRKDNDDTLLTIKTGGIPCLAFNLVQYRREPVIMPFSLFIDGSRRSFRLCAVQRIR